MVIASIGRALKVGSCLCVYLSLVACGADGSRPKDAVVVRSEVVGKPEDVRAKVEDITLEDALTAMDMRLWAKEVDIHLGGAHEKVYLHAVHELHPEGADRPVLKVLTSWGGVVISEGPQRMLIGERRESGMMYFWMGGKRVEDHNMMRTSKEAPTVQVIERGGSSEVLVDLRANWYWSEMKSDKTGSYRDQIKGRQFVRLIPSKYRLVKAESSEGGVRLLEIPETSPSALQFRMLEGWCVRSCSL